MRLAPLRLFCSLASVGACLGLSACAGGGNRPAAADAEGAPGSLARRASDAPATRPAKRPFMFGEAKLPSDFPPPGPVGEVIVKQYPAYRAARVAAADDRGRRDQNAMFRPLFDHITRNDIAMTAPVEIGFAGDSNAGSGTATASPDSPGRPTSMAFMYADPSIGRPGADGDVEVVDLPPVTVVSVGVRGSYDADQFAKGMSQIRRYLAGQPKYRVAGAPRFLGYNSPFVPSFMRYGEVQLPVTTAEPGNPSGG